MGVDYGAARAGIEALVAKLYDGMRLPEVGIIRQRLSPPAVQDIEGTVRSEVERVLQDCDRRPCPVAVGIGSRGIANLQPIVYSVVNTLRAGGFEPFIVPAMGSHGGATVAGQVAILSELGITEDSMGVPLRATMDVEMIGRIEGLPVYMDKYVVETGAAFLVNRVKPHTDYVGPIESGVAKMAAVGLGHLRGAQAYHSAGTHGLRDLVPAAARLAAERGYLVGGLGVIENQLDQTAGIKGLTAAEIGGPVEAALLSEARSLMPRIPFDTLDVLVIDRVGKDISGCNMDTNVLNRYRIPGMVEPPGLQITAIVALDLTEVSQGNAVGIGIADVISERLASKVDLVAMYTNALTAGIFGLERGQIPLIVPRDEDAILAAINGRGRMASERLRLAWIADTLHVEVLGVSEVLYDAAAQRDDLELLRSPGQMPICDGHLMPLLEFMRR